MTEAESKIRFGPAGASFAEVLANVGAAMLLLLAMQGLLSLHDSKTALPPGLLIAAAVLLLSIAVYAAWTRRSKYSYVFEPEYLVATLGELTRLIRYGEIRSITAVERPAGSAPWVCVETADGAYRMCALQHDALVHELTSRSGVAVTQAPYVPFAFRWYWKRLYMVGAILCFPLAAPGRSLAAVLGLMVFSALWILNDGPGWDIREKREITWANIWPLLIFEAFALYGLYAWLTSS